MMHGTTNIKNNSHLRYLSQEPHRQILVTGTSECNTGHRIANVCFLIKSRVLQHSDDWIVLVRLARDLRVCVCVDKQ